MSDAPAASARAAALKRRARTYCMTDTPVAVPKAWARCDRETPHAVAIPSSVSDWVELRSMIHSALSGNDTFTLLFQTVTRDGGLALDNSSSREVCVGPAAERIPCAVFQRYRSNQRDLKCGRRKGRSS